MLHTVANFMPLTASACRLQVFDAGCRLCCMIVTLVWFVIPDLSLGLDALRGLGLGLESWNG